jgi:anti-sigma factor RsiW
MATPHLTSEELQRYRAKTMSAREFGGASRHLASCGRCARRLRLVDAGPAVPALAEQLEHVTYEDLVAYLDGSPSESERQWVEGHAHLCERCGRQLRDLQELETYLSNDAAARATSRVPDARGSRWRLSGSWWAWANVAAAAAIVVLFVVLGAVARVRERGGLTTALGPLGNVIVDARFIAVGFGIGTLLVLILLVSVLQRHRRKGTKGRRR